MALSSVSVLTSSLSLNRYRAPTFSAKKYGRDLRGGELGIEKIVYTVSSGRQHDITVKCEAAMITESDEHAKSLIDRAERKNFPGCHDAWNKKCECNPCRCLGCPGNETGTATKRFT
jgi:hypothetical protein